MCVLHMITIKTVSDLQNNNELLPDAADESHVSLIKILLAELKKGEDSAAKNGWLETADVRKILGF